MELKQTLLLGTLVGLVSCHWFDPTDVDLARQERTHVFVNAVVGADSTHRSISSVGSIPTSTTWRKPSKRVYGWTSPRTYPVQRVAVDLPKAWGCGCKPTLFIGIEPGEELSLQVTFDRWDDLTATSMIPSGAHLVKWLKSRSIQEGDKIFDEVELEHDSGSR